jgi:hypothetical protein
MRKFPGDAMIGAACVTTMVFPAIVNVAERCGSMLAAIVMLNVPVPVREADDPIVIHAGIPVADHAHPLLVEIEKLLVLLAAATDTLAGDTVKVQVPACVTVNVRPPIVTAPVRSVAPVLAATRMVDVPFPEPLPPAVTEIHDAPPVAVHAQPFPAVTVTVDVSPAAATVLLAGLIA